MTGRRCGALAVVVSLLGISLACVDTTRSTGDAIDSGSSTAGAAATGSGGSDGGRSASTAGGPGVAGAQPSSGAAGREQAGGNAGDHGGAAAESAGAGYSGTLTAGAGGAPSAGGASAVAGTAGAPGTGGLACDVWACDDDDPCTIDLCDADGECVHHSTGVTHDGVSLTFSVGNASSIALAANDLGFYVALERADDPTNEVVLYSLRNDETALREGPALAGAAILGEDELRPIPGGGVALVASAEAPRTVTAIAALMDAPEGATSDTLEYDVARVWAIDFDEDLQPLDPLSAYPVPTGANDDHYSPWGPGPIAWHLAGQTHVAWVDSANWIQLHTFGGVTQTLGEPELEPIWLTPLGSAEAPGLMWLGSNPNWSRIFAEHLGNNPTRTVVQLCEGSRGTSTVDAAHLADGTWAAVWSFDSGDLSWQNRHTSIQTHTVRCEAGTCLQILDCSGQPVEGFYSAAIATTTRNSEPGVVYQANFQTTTEPNYITGSTETGSLQVLWKEVGAGGRSVQLEEGQGLQVQRSDNRRVSSAQVEFSAGNRVAVAWVDSRVATSTTEWPEPNPAAHIERFRVCPPTAADLAALDE